VKLEYENKKVYISTTENDIKKNFLSKSEALSLLAIANKEPGLLDTLFNKKAKEEEKKLLVKFGLDESTNFDEYFEYGFNLEEGLVIKRKRKAKGLIPVAGNVDLPILSFINKSSVQNDVLTSLKKSKGNRKLVFVLVPHRYFNDGFGDFSDNQTNLNYNISPVIGKPNKAGTQIVSHIEAYLSSHDFDYQVEKSENAEEIMKILEDIENCVEERLRFQLYKLAFNLLVDEPLVYGFRDVNDEIRKNNLEHIKLSKEPLDIFFEVKQGKEFVELELKLKLNGEQLNKNSLNKS
jgi:hypothetical protein